MLGFVYRVADALRQRRQSATLHPDQAAGRRGEDIAQRYLQRQGMIIIARNWRREDGGGELDLVALDPAPDGDTLVIVEVKSRATDEYGAPDRAIGEEKRMSLLRMARSFAGRAHIPWERVRFDVVGIVFGPPFQLIHWRDVFPPRQH